MKIAICETEHFEVAYTLLTLFDNGENELSLFIHRAAYDQLIQVLRNKISCYRCYIKEPSQKNREFIHKIFGEIQKEDYDLIYFSTIDNNFILYANYLTRLQKGKTVMNIHDINSHFVYRPALSLRRLFRFIGKRKLIRTINSFNVLSEELVPPLATRLCDKRPIYTVSGGFFDPSTYYSATYSPDSPVQITIPGSVDERRRNYGVIFELLDQARIAGINISVTFLGAFNKKHSAATRQNCEDYLNKYSNLRIYTSSVVDQSEFDQVLQNSHFIILALQQQTIVNDGVMEYYGRTIYSGNIGDIIRHAKPFFASTQLPLENHLEKCCSRYKTINDIIHVLEQLTPGKYNSMQELAYQASLHYTKDKIISRNAGLFI